MRAFFRVRRPRQQDRHHGAEHVGRGRVRARERGVEVGRREAFLVGHADAHQKRLEEGVQRVGVKQRQRRLQNVFAGEPEQRRGVGAPPEILRVRTADALRRPGGAGRVEDRQHVARPHRLSLAGFRRDGEGRRRDLADAQGRFGVDGPDRLQRQRGHVEMIEIAGESAFHDQQPRRGIGQDVLELMPARGGVDRHRHGADPGAAEEGAEEFEPVGADERDAVTALDAGRAQSGAEARGLVARLRVGPALPTGGDEGLAAEALRLPGQHGRHGAVGGRKVTRQRVNEPGGRRAVGRRLDHLAIISNLKHLGAAMRFDASGG